MNSSSDSSKIIEVISAAVGSTLKDFEKKLADESTARFRDMEAKLHSANSAMENSVRHDVEALEKDFRLLLRGLTQ